MKKITSLILTLFMIVVLIPKQEVSAIDIDKVYDEELKVAIISGDGSEDNPYVVDYDKAPNFKAYMESLETKVMNSLQGDLENNGISTFGIYDGIMTGTKKTGQTKGGQWKYSSGKPSVAVNGNIWMKKVVYISIANTKNIRNTLASTLAKDIIVDNLTDIAKKPFDSALELLIKKGLSEGSATSVLIGLGKLNSLFTAAEVTKFVNDLFILSRYNTAVNNGYGMLNVIYATSYNGSWYAQYGEDTWTTASTVYLPGSAYGTGTYTAYTK